MYFNIYDLVLWSFAGAKEKKFFSSNKTLEKIPFSVVHFRVTSTVCNVVNTIVMQTHSVFIARHLSSDLTKIRQVTRIIFDGNNDDVKAAALSCFIHQFRFLHLFLSLSQVMLMQCAKYFPFMILSVKRHLTKEYCFKQRVV